MIYHPYGDVNGVGLYTNTGGSSGGTPAISPLPTGRFRGIAIGPNSAVDCVLVDGQRLAPGRVLLGPFDDKTRILPVRSIRTDGDQGVANVGFQLLQLALYEACDELVPLGPRAPYEARATVPANAGVWARSLRLPFQGRSMAKVALRMTTDPGDASTNEYVIFGVTYIPRDRLKPILDTPSDSSAGRTALITGTYGYRDASVDGVIGGFGTFERVDFVGGTDNGETYDELEVWQRAGFASAVWAEAYDRASAGGM